MTNDDLQNILKRPGYGVRSSLGKGIEPTIRDAALDVKAGGKGKDSHLEPAISDESLRAEAVSLNYTGKCRVRLRFFRKRLADYSRAIAEKAQVDSLVYGGAIRDDSQKEIWLIDEGQEKVATDQEERTEIILEYEAVDLDNPFVAKTKFGNASK